MFERFTDGARQVLVLAQEEAGSLRHNYVGTEHLLLGVARQVGVGAAALRRLGFDAEVARAEAQRQVGEGNGSGLRPGDAEVLRSIGIDLDEVRRQVEGAFGPGALERARWRRRCRPRGRSDALPFTPRAKKCLELALREALALRHGNIGTEHVLLGLLREGEGLAAVLLGHQGIGLDAARLAVLTELGTGDVSLPRRRRRLPGWRRGDRPGVRHRRARRARRAL